MSDDDIFAALEAAYAERLEQRAVLWQTKHPEEARALRESVAVQFRRPGMPDPEPGSLAWLTIEAAVVEAIRAKKGWPTLREWERLNAGHEPAPPVRTTHPKPLPMPKNLERVDHKAIAAGDR